MSDEAVMVKGIGSLYLAGPPLVQVTPTKFTISYSNELDKIFAKMIFDFAFCTIFV